MRQQYGLSELGIMIQATLSTAHWAMDVEILTGAKPTKEQQGEYWQATLDHLRGHVLIDAEPVRLALPEGTHDER
jgi:hypothetical protein